MSLQFDENNKRWRRGIVGVGSYVNSHRQDNANMMEGASILAKEERCGGGTHYVQLRTG